MKPIHALESLGHSHRPIPLPDSPAPAPLPVSPGDLIRFSFRESTVAEDAAHNIAELVHAIFGPFDSEAAEG